MRYFTMQFAPGLLLYKIWDIYLSNNILDDLFCLISCSANETVRLNQIFKDFFFSHTARRLSACIFFLLFVYRTNVPFNKKFPNLTKLSTKRHNDYIMMS